jgi:hypothetical protein
MQMLKRWLSGALALACASPVTAQTMPVADFLAKAEALQKRGPTALFSSDYKLLKREAEGSGKALRASAAAARKAGRAPIACLPEKAATNSDELLKHLRSIPPAQRSMPIGTAFNQLMAKKYPC